MHAKGISLTTFQASSWMCMQAIARLACRYGMHQEDQQHFPAITAHVAHARSDAQFSDSSYPPASVASIDANDTNLNMLCKVQTWVERERACE